jgi:hypothetical protein
MGVSRKKAWIVIYSSRFSNIGGAPDVGVAKSRVKLGVTPTKRKEEAGYAYCDLTIVDKIIEVL